MFNLQRRKIYSINMILYNILYTTKISKTLTWNGGPVCQDRMQTYLHSSPMLQGNCSFFRPLVAPNLTTLDPPSLSLTHICDPIVFFYNQKMTSAHQSSFQSDTVGVSSPSGVALHFSSLNGSWHCIMILQYLQDLHIY